MNLLNPCRRVLASRHGGVALFFALFLAVSFLTRTALLVKSSGQVDWNASLLATFAWGLVFDLGTAFLCASPLVVVLTLLPGTFFAARWARGLAYGFFFGVTCLLLFNAVGEWLFWDEFSTRFNFIAVDYLVYTTEVIGNIRESYPLPAIFLGLGAVAIGSFALLVKTGWLTHWLAAPHGGWKQRFTIGGAWLAVTGVVLAGLDAEMLPPFANTLNRELARNGVWSLVAAFRNNELSYEQFYPTVSSDEAFAVLRTELASDGSAPLPSDGPDTLRYIRNSGVEIHPNVIQITVESLSADFLSTFNHASKLSPNLEQLAAKSLVFDRFYATGTRTDRGMEALTLAIPPTPGRSLVKRPENDDLFSLGSLFRSRGYDTAFIYGGYGYFDNMNTFFSGNGYRVIDRGSAAASDITFANAWGACDEDLLRWTLREADAVAATGKPFHFFVMTTSNHRPYTFPAGRIDLPSKISGRSGAVKYTDFAIGQFLREAESKPWFKNTIFVIVADHCASVAGRSELPVQNYHIPLFIYAPGGQVPPGHVPEVTSQIDYAPTLLGLLNWSYATRFYGWDVRQARGDRRALIGNYQKLGLFEPGMLSVLSPLRGNREYAYDHATFNLTPRPATPAYTQENIAYYQTASELFRTRRYRAVSADDQRRLAAVAQAGTGSVGYATP